MFELNFYNNKKMSVFIFCLKESKSAFRRSFKFSLEKNRKRTRGLKIATGPLHKYSETWAKQGSINLDQPFCLYQLNFIPSRAIVERLLKI